MSNPWRIDETDVEEIVQTRCDRRTSLPPRPPTAQTARTLIEPKTPDWSPEIEEETGGGGGGPRRRFNRRKTAPSFERAPSQNKPIFSGPPSLRSSANSLFESTQQPRVIHTYIPDTPPASPMNSNSQYDPFGMIQDNLNRFIYTYIPKEYPSFFRCFLRRDKGGFQKGLFPTYYLHAERPSDGKKILLLAARKVAKLKQQSEYLITTNIETLSEKSCGEGFAGRLRANGISSTEYTLYDHGKSPNKYGYKPSHCKQGLRRELAGIIYNTNVFGFKGPREMNTIIPKPDQDIQPAQGEETIFDRWESMQFTDTLQLRNRLPSYKHGSKAPMLQFINNSSIQASVKNFQMVMATDTLEEEVVLQFGRLTKDTFLCDFRYPLSTVQAFGIALSSFDSTIARE